ncbi:MAG: prephenate dehydrogenase/arogenate dehydrogenase family protein [Deltaproteobacteria bacterium]|nr:prephenate dehydrogenase/arogenate dehydrogenase family protein [Deltaproteobacteria bacterium]
MIGILGFGRFGRLMSRYLARDFEVTVFDSGGKASGIAKTGAAAATLEQVCGEDIVILPVPISVFGQTLKKIQPLLREDALVIDVCSVKTYPVALMQKLLPEGISILATHPMFGPDSAADSLEGHKIVLCPERIEEDRYLKIRSYLDSTGLHTIEATPDEHDRQISISLAMTHFIGRSLSEFGAHPLGIDTEGYKRLLHVLEVVENDTWQLFVDMHHYNPYARKHRAEMIEAVNRVESKLRESVEGRHA